MDFWRGNEIKLIDDCWVYVSDSIKVSDDPYRKCGFCFLDNREDEFDACIGFLENTMNACCGHGNKDSAYRQLLDGTILKGEGIFDI